MDIAIEAGIEVQSSVCRDRTGQTCRFFEGCPKQENLREVAAAAVVVATYDALFTGFSGNTDDVGLVIVDEGCWQRAEQEHVPIPLDTLTLLAGSLRPRAGSDPMADMADLHDLRTTLQSALSSCEGPVPRKSLLSAGLTAEACRLAARLEERLVRNPKLRPGMTPSLRKMSRRVASTNSRARSFVALWIALADLLASGAERDGRVCVEMAGNARHVLVRGVKRVHTSLAGKPVLHLDATLRPELARTILPRLRTGEVEAAAPNMHLTLVTSSFGKGMLCPTPGLAQAEARRRGNRRRECVDYVRWQAAKVAPGKVLVVTYKSIEAAFAGIPNVSVAHFNAIAGLDAYREVRSLIVIGRPLPSDADLLSPTAALLAHASEGSYRKVTRGVRMRDGTSRAVEVVEHGDPKAELLRAAICDDELIQAIGRGRGVNRTAENPLDVHVLADVALPLVHDRVVQWDGARPDIVQRMLLAGVAVDSPADAACLHPDLFDNPNQARLSLVRAGFGGQNPIRGTHREMTVKSAAYRRGGRGRSWQRVWWFAASAAEVRQRLEAALDHLAEWRCD
ncbi:hypothetical protein [Roseitranquillus sediminis]|uniref:hypothetical protein n=1 Tax=Roseitranquillus sediminis TaxID=2809051 RepID=UPI001D0C5816|nr:hypothetical protein [Roseitranquillus sediminis]MBM9595507.1 hypothetical protein [Roseitranquillus sediminis]